MAAIVVFIATVLAPDDPYPSLHLLALLHPEGLLHLLSEYWFLGLLAFLFLSISSLVSGFEAACLALPRRDVSVPEALGTPDQHPLLHKLLRAPRRLHATLLLANLASNIGLVAVLHYMYMYTVQPHLGWHPVLQYVLEGALIFGGVFVIAEAFPKLYGSAHSLRFIQLWARPVYVLHLLLWPLATGLHWLSRRVAGSGQAQRRQLTAQELKQAIEMASEEETPKEEKRLLKALVNLNSISVRSIMQARRDIQGLPAATPLPDVLRSIQRYGYSRIPVYEDSLDNILGILYVKDLLKQQHDSPGAPWQEVLRQPYFVPESKKINRLLNEFRQLKLHIALVVDEFGGTAGLVTLEDILQEVFGDITDNSLQQQYQYSQLGDAEYVFEGRMPLLDVCRVAGLADNAFDEWRADSESLGGLLLELGGHLPARGEVLATGRYSFTVESVSETMIKRVKLVILPEAAEADED